MAVNCINATTTVNNLCLSIPYTIAAAGVKTLPQT